MALRKKCIGLLAAALLCFTAASASAEPLLYGSFSIFSFFTPVDGETGVVTPLADATGIDFLGGSTPNTGSFSVVAANGSFASLIGQTGTIKDFSFLGSGSAAYPLPPISGFETLSVGNLSFDLEQIYVMDRSDAVLHLTGSGMFTAAGYAPTGGIFDFYGTANGASLAINPVPEPASLVLLGSGVIAGIGSLRRRRRSQQA